MQTTLVLDNQYFPCISYVKMLRAYPLVQLEYHENYQKNSFRNRCVIAGSNGLINLSIPLVNGRDQKIPYRELQIDYSQAWQVQQWRTITSCYRKAPFFEYYAHIVEGLIFQHHPLLFDKNRSILEWVIKVFKLPVTLENTTDYIPVYDGKVADARNLLQPKNHQQQAPDLLPYFQMFEDRIGFQPNLSILDLLFCAGPHAL